MDVPTVAPTAEFPNRPDHLDFDILSALVVTMDDDADEVGSNFDMSDYVSHYIDSESLAYLALQRAMRILGVTTVKQVEDNMNGLARLASVYHEGFIMGCRFQQTKGTSNATQ